MLLEGEVVVCLQVSLQPLFEHQPFLEGRPGIALGSTSPLSRRLFSHRFMVGIDTEKVSATSCLGLPASTAGSTLNLRSFEYGFMPGGANTYGSILTGTAVRSRFHLYEGIVSVYFVSLFEQACLEPLRPTSRLNKLPVRSCYALAVTPSPRMRMMLPPNTNGRLAPSILTEFTRSNSNP